jgi:RNA polymerase sigma-70 factor (ECF subfamily)
LKILARGKSREAAPLLARPPDDQELVVRILAGDDAAFGTLVQTYWERLFRLALGILGDWHLSEDVLQEVFVLVHRKLGSFDGRSSLLTWLYRVTVNAALKARQRERRKSLPSLSPEFDRSAPGPASGSELEMKELGQKLLRCLPAKLRAVVLLREWEGLGYEEIGRVLGLSRGAVEQRLHRAMVELRRVWNPARKEEWLHGL